MVTVVATKMMAVDRITAEIQKRILQNSENGK
jgi:hypothetical protein